ncbi:MAG: ATP-dependent helicase [Lachnospiraceae bacterium]|nr:ATP-dependent helicase [Lachnospiraceae bacterium]
MKKCLNDSQMQAVLHQEGPMMVLAGPGSGKTLVITRRIENLIKNADIDPSNILVITFTKSAASEMKERFLRRMPTEGKRVTFGTFHAVFFMILKHAYGFRAENVIREDEKIYLMREMLHSMRLDYEDENEFIQNLFAEIGLVKNSRIQLAHYYSTNCGQDVFRQIYKEYEQFLHRNRKIDFDDMLVYTYELFSQRKDILSAWQNKYRYILVDEFQDVNQIQYDIVRMLAASGNNLFVVGDDDQSIYRFRGAKPEIMLNMPKDFKDLKMVNLSVNYRCPASVVKMASQIISHNRERFEKEIHAAKKGGLPILIEKFESQREEYEKVLARIRKGKIPYSQIAVLFRTNMQARGLMELLLEYNIPFTAKDTVPNIYEHWIAKDLFAYIRIAKGSRQRRDFLMIMNRPKRYLSRESLEEETVAFDVWQAFYSEQPWIEERIEKLQRDIREISRMRPFAAINYIRKAIGYDEFIKEYAEYRKISAEELFDVLEELQESSKVYPNFDTWFLHMEKYKKELEQMREKGNIQEEAVTLATYHSAKGLEFDVVHMIDVNEGVTPYKKAVLPADMEEERRMFYVGITRAKEELYLYCAKKINNHEAEISRFLMEADIE